MSARATWTGLGLGLTLLRLLQHGGVESRLELFPTNREGTILVNSVRALENHSCFYITSFTR